MNYQIYDIKIKLLTNYGKYHYYNDLLIIELIPDILYLIKED